MHFFRNPVSRFKYEADSKTSAKNNNRIFHSQKIKPRRGKNTNLRVTYCNQSNQLTMADHEQPSSLPELSDKVADILHRRGLDSEQVETNMERAAAHVVGT
jgi:hypothetical protein